MCIYRTWACVRGVPGRTLTDACSTSLVHSLLHHDGGSGIQFTGKVFIKEGHAGLSLTEKRHYIKVHLRYRNEEILGKNIELVLLSLHIIFRIMMISFGVNQ